MPKCPTCNKPSKLVTGDVIYPHRPDLSNKYFYLCKKHNSYVGCHPDSKDALGNLADAATRELRSRVHKMFDPLWKDKHFKSRKVAYEWFAYSLKIKRQKCHVAMFDEVQCHQALAILQEQWDEIKIDIKRVAEYNKWQPKKSLFRKE